MHDLKTNKKKHVYSERNGFDKLETNYKHRQLIVTECGIDPNIYRYDSDLNLVEVFKGKFLISDSEFGSFQNRSFLIQGADWI